MEKTKGSQVLEKTKGKAKGKKVLEKTKGKAKGKEVLEKTSTYKEVLEKTPKVFKMPKARDLEKSSGKKLLVVVDWRNTFEVKEDVSGRNSYALTLLLQRCDVLILSSPPKKGRRKS